MDQPRSLQDDSPEASASAHHDTDCARVDDAAGLAVLCDVSAGMACLESKHCVHRDLACRDILCLLDGTCLVADFGMSRALQEDKMHYRVRAGAQIPLRWSAPELVKGRTHTTSSDVWSFFVFAWEVFSRGERPFGKMMDIVRCCA